MNQDQFRHEIWARVVNAASVRWLRATMAELCAQPTQPFADAGEAMSRSLSAGATEADLCRIVRHAKFEAACNLLYMLNDPGVDSTDFLFEGFGSADPSGAEGATGSWNPG